MEVGKRRLAGDAVRATSMDEGRGAASYRRTCPTAALHSEYM